MSIKRVEDLSLQELYLKKAEIENEMAQVLDMLQLMYDKVLLEIQKNERALEI